MIPNRIRLRNFMSHENMDLDLTAIHAAVLTGSNGAGKSAILESIIWALWGKCRSDNDEVIRIGQAECQVELTFECEGALYRVTRRRSTKKGVATQLELCYIPDSVDTDKNIPMTGAGVKETQLRINDLLKIDYETFTASVFLGQGKSDTFTVAKPTERKALLGEILGLSQYDILAQGARDRGRIASVAVDSLEGTIARLRARAMEAGDLDGALVASKLASDQAAAARQALDELLAKLQAEALLTAAAAAEALRHEQARLAAVAILARIDGEILGLRGQAVIPATRADVEQAHTVWQQLTAAEATARTRADAWQALQQRIGQEEAQGRDGLHRIDLAIAGREENGRAARRDLERRLEEARTTAAGHAALVTEHAKVQAELAAVEALLPQLEAVQLNGIELRAAYDLLKADGVRIVERCEATAAKITRMDAELGHDGCEATCPLCASSLSGERLANLRTQLIQEMQTDAEKRCEVAEALAQAEPKLEASRAAYVDLRDRIKGQADIQRREVALAGQVSQAADAVSLVVWLESAASVQEVPDTELVALQSERAALVAANLAVSQASLAEQQAVGHDAAGYAVLRGQLAEVAEAPARWAELQQALLAVEQAQSAIARLEGEREGHVRSASEAAIAANEARIRATRHGDCERELAATQSEVIAQRNVERLAQQEVARIEAAITRAQEDAAELVIREVEWNRATEDVRTFKTLDKAFGKGGIQAHAIEAAIPEIEEEANRILGGICENQMRITLVTQRDTKAGTVVETLDVRIEDDAGARPYESYSGGEAFRINFAIRLALSRLLARRAGARLETLVIDEGFGSQDDQGRARLVEAINAVSGEFRRILVVTHIRELRELFNTQIDVTKVRGVSHVRVAG